MRLVIVVNDIFTEEHTNTTVYIAMAATNMDHEVWFTDVANLIYDEDESVYAVSRKVKGENYIDTKKYMEDLKEKDFVEKKLKLDDVDVIFLRNDPAEDEKTRPWAQYAGIIFGRLAVRKGVIVLNDPEGLSKSLNKLYFQTFPQEVRPKTVITRNFEEIKRFFEENEKIILKPAVGSQGRNVFLVSKEDVVNLEQMFQSVAEHGYVIAQEFIPEVREGDIRLFTLNGEVLKIDNKIAAFKRVPKEGSIKVNIHAGGKFQKAKITEDILKMAEKIRPKLIEDGIFFAGLDILGDKLLEVNVFSPGGIDKVKILEGVDFSPLIVKAIERKVMYKKIYGNNISNQMYNVL